MPRRVETVTHSVPKPRPNPTIYRRQIPLRLIALTSLLPPQQARHVPPHPPSPRILQLHPIHPIHHIEGLRLLCLQRGHRRRTQDAHRRAERHRPRHRRAAPLVLQPRHRALLLGRAVPVDALGGRGRREERQEGRGVETPDCVFGEGVYEFGGEGAGCEG